MNAGVIKWKLWITWNTAQYYLQQPASSALTLLIGWQEGHPARKNWVVGCWHGCLSGVRCRLAYGPADATATFTFLVPACPGSPGKKRLLNVRTYYLQQCLVACRSKRSMSKDQEQTSIWHLKVNGKPDYTMVLVNHDPSMLLLWQKSRHVWTWKI